MERGPPNAFCYLGSGPTNGRRHGPAPGFGFETTSDQIDSDMPGKRILGAQDRLLQLPNSGGAEGIVANVP